MLRVRVATEPSGSVPRLLRAAPVGDYLLLLLFCLKKFRMVVGVGFAAPAFGFLAADAGALASADGLGLGSGRIKELCFSSVFGAWFAIIAACVACRSYCLMGCRDCACSTTSRPIHATAKHIGAPCEESIRHL